MNKNKFGVYSPELALELNNLGYDLVLQERYSDAEPVLREALAIREVKLPGDWRVFESRCLLGAAMSGRKMYAGAESLLVSGYEGLKQRATEIPEGGRTQLGFPLTRLVRLYAAWERPDQTAQWQRKLDEFNQQFAGRAGGK